MVNFKLDICDDVRAPRKAKLENIQLTISKFADVPTLPHLQVVPVIEGGY
jgi:hypothetical protein